MFRLFSVLFLIIIFNFSAAAWGDEGHKLIAKKALQNLPKEMAGIQNWHQYIIDHSVDPDYRRKEDDSEFPKHFIDVDFYSEFNTGRMPFDKNVLTEKYGDSTVTAMGIIPWVINDTYYNLVNAFLQKNRDRMLFYAADLAHYVGDAHNPMHTMLNYNGQLTGQNGIHSRYESKMLKKYLTELEEMISPAAPDSVADPLAYAFNFITDANSVGAALMAADMHAAHYSLPDNTMAPPASSAGIDPAAPASAEQGSTVKLNREGDEYYELLWFRTRYITAIQFNQAAHHLSSLIYSAWISAGKPDLSKVN